jgi:protein-arginine kinase
LNISVISDNNQSGISENFTQLQQVLNIFEQQDLEFNFHKTFGYLTSCPTLFGFGLELTFLVKLDNLNNNDSSSLIKTITENSDHFILNRNQTENSVLLTYKYKYCYQSEKSFLENVYFKLINIIMHDLTPE